MGRWFRLPHTIRKYFRKRMEVMPYDKALSKKHTFTLIYAFCAWNVLGIIFYKAFTYDKDGSKPTPELSEGRRFIKLLKIENPQLYRVSGLSSIQKINVDEEQQSETIEKI